jgi:hypothetical protein
MYNFFKKVTLFIRKIFPDSALASKLHNDPKTDIELAMEKMLDDGILTDKEEKELNRYAELLGLDKSTYDSIRSKVFYENIQHIMDNVKETKRFTPENEKALIAIAEKQQINISFTDNIVGKYRQLWEIETTGKYVPTAIKVGIRLSKGEECYFETSSVWKRNENIREHKGYIGGSLGFRITKGITLRVGRAVPVYDEYKSVEPISNGMLYITNKKIIFIGNDKSTTITLGRLANYKLYKNAIQINKTSGQPDIFTLEEDDILILDPLLQVL